MPSSVAFHLLLRAILILQKIPESYRINLKVSSSQSRVPSHATLQQAAWSGSSVTVKTMGHSVGQNSQFRNLWLRRTLHEIVLWRQLEDSNIVPFCGVCGDMFDQKSTFQMVYGCSDGCGIMDSIKSKDVDDLKKLRPGWVSLCRDVQTPAKR